MKHTSELFRFVFRLSSLFFIKLNVIKCIILLYELYIFKILFVHYLLCRHLLNVTLEVLRTSP